MPRPSEEITSQTFHRPPHAKVSRRSTTKATCWLKRGEIVDHTFRALRNLHLRGGHCNRVCGSPTGAALHPLHTNGSTCL
eukprot:6413511-Amphidinium_carterae.1